ncbi:hypothetical protein N7468_009982 [Penicillium chermesinum]|uniref:CID domain-containing protein n=1 Tax=Penicillium chermesinum TaxID=63820 RepID=A0A9W9NBW2_9EURO|nr:uncharacterized protein N7468_009982 [Penicillium chermesinum]KAJ5216974.1 hypothetical protein N7468_009982 [Penicillium chermesinum]
MAFTDDAVKAKLSALNETQESIVTVAQWVMFYKRHAERTAQIWLNKIHESPPPKRLNLIYLANELAQQSKAKNKDDFLNAFAPIIVEATGTAYKGSSVDIQQKLRRVVEVWRARRVFEEPILDAVEARVNEIDKTRSTTKKQPLGGSFFRESSSSSIPSELRPLVPLQTALTKAAMTSGPKHTSSSPPVHAARLSQLLKTLANAESSVSDVIKCRRAIINELDKILESNRSDLAREEALFTKFSERKAEIDAKKHEVEDAIVQGFDNDQEISPDVEALTPPPVEALTPVASPKPEQQQQQQHVSHGPFSEDTPVTLPQSLVIPNAAQVDQGTEFPTAISPVGGNDFDFGSNGTGAKRRKLSHGEEDYAQYATGDLDADVADMIAQEERQQR